MQDMIDARWAISVMKRQVNDKCTIYAPFTHDLRTISARFMHQLRTISARFMHHLRTIYARFMHDERNAHVVHVYRLVLHDNRQGLMHDKYN